MVFSSLALNIIMGIRKEMPITIVGVFSKKCELTILIRLVKLVAAKRRTPITKIPATRG